MRLAAAIWALATLASLAGCAVPFDNFEGATYADAQVAIIDGGWTCCIESITSESGDLVYEKSRDQAAARAVRNPIKLRPGRYVVTLDATWRTCVVRERGPVDFQAGHHYSLQTSGHGCGLMPQGIWLADDATGDILVGQRRWK